MKQEEIIRELEQNTGTEHYFKIPFSDYTYTDGIEDLIKKCKCWWLVSDMGIELNQIKKVPNFLILRLEVNEDKTALLSLREDTNKQIVYSKKLKYTDFPLKEFEFYIIDKIMLLKSEY